MIYDIVIATVVIGVAIMWLWIINQIIRRIKK